MCQLSRDTCAVVASDGVQWLSGRLPLPGSGCRARRLSVPPLRRRCRQRLSAVSGGERVSGRHRRRRVRRRDVLDRTAGQLHQLPGRWAACGIIATRG